MTNITGTRQQILTLVAPLNRSGMILFVIYLLQVFVYQTALINSCGHIIKTRTPYQLGRHMTVFFIPHHDWTLWIHVLLFGTRHFRSRYPALFGLSFIIVSSHGITYREEGSRALVFVLSAGLMRNRLSTCSLSVGYGNLLLTFLLTISILMLVSQAFL